MQTTWKPNIIEKKQEIKQKIAGIQTQSLPQLSTNLTHFHQATPQKNWTQGVQPVLDEPIGLDIDKKIFEQQEWKHFRFSITSRNISEKYDNSPSQLPRRHSRQEVVKWIQFVQ